MFVRCRLTSTTTGYELPDLQYEESTTTAPPDSNCQDLNTECKYWATPGAYSLLGECIRNPLYMLQTCAYSCNFCGMSSVLRLASHNHVGLTPEEIPSTPPCVDQFNACKLWEREGRCDTDQDGVLESCPAACGSCDTSTPSTASQSTTTTSTGPSANAMDVQGSLDPFDYFSSVPLHEDLQLYWTCDSSHISVLLVADTQGYVGFGLTGMWHGMCYH